MATVPSANEGVRSYVLARTPADLPDDAILGAVLKKVQDTPEYREKLATQSLTSELYALQ